tara:strand:+ start:78 stop:416 length:339 start_codon:yes stop_codon:yes gene_type:complete
MGTHGKMNRPRIEKAIEFGILDYWISAKDVAWAINNEYTVADDKHFDKRTGKTHYRKRGRKNVWMTTMMAARILTEFVNSGLLECKRQYAGSVSLYRKVDKSAEHVNMEEKV